MDVPTLVYKAALQRVRCSPRSRISKLYARMRDLNPDAIVVIMHDGRVLPDEEDATMRSEGVVVRTEGGATMSAHPLQCFVVPAPPPNKPVGAQKAAMDAVVEAASRLQAVVAAE